MIKYNFLVHMSRMKLPISRSKIVISAFVEGYKE